MPDIDIKTQQDVTKVLHEVRGEIKRLDEEGRDRHEILDKAVDTIRQAQQVQDAARIANEQYSQRAQGDDAEVEAAFVIRGDSEVKFAGQHSITRDLAIRGQRLAQGKRNCVAAKDVGVVRMVGGNDEDGVWVEGLCDARKALSPWHEKLQTLVDRRNFARACQAVPHTPSLDRQVLSHLRRGPGLIGKLFSDATGAGAEWIPDNTMPALEREMELARRVEALFDTFDIPAGGTLNVPFLSTGLRPYLSGAPTTEPVAQFTSSSLGTANRTVTASKLAVRMVVDRDSSEDSLIATESIGRQALVEALRDGVEDAILNGDTGTHQDTGLSAWNIRSRWGATGLGSSADHRRAWIGVRARATDVSNTADGGSLQTAARIAGMLATLDVPHALGSVVALTSLEYIVLKLLADTNLLTVDKVGQVATILTGQVGSIFGVPIIPTEFMDKELNASGVFDDTTKTKTALALFNRDRFKMGIRRGARVETQTDITRDIDNFVATRRCAFTTFDSATKKNVAVDYNLSPA